MGAKIKLCKGGGRLKQNMARSRRNFPLMISKGIALTLNIVACQAHPALVKLGPRQYIAQNATHLPRFKEGVGPKRTMPVVKPEEFKFIFYESSLKLTPLNQLFPVKLIQPLRPCSPSSTHFYSSLQLHPSLALQI